MSSKPSLEQRQKIYRSLCYVLSERAEQVMWDEYTPADWDLFAQMADREGVAPLMYWKLKASPVAVPPSTFNLLHSTYYQTLAQNTLMYQELERILQALDGAGIPVIVLKGAALAVMVYEDIGLRPMGDLDLLVKRGQVEASVEILESLGYEKPHRNITSLLDWNLVHHVVLKEGRYDKVAVEMHWNLIAGDADWRAPPVEWFWEQVEGIPFPSDNGFSERMHSQDAADGIQTAAVPRSILVLSPSAHLLYLAAHAMLHHGGAEARLLWFYDLHLVATDCSSKLDWKVIVQRASEYQWAPALRAALDKSRSLLGTPVPDTAYAPLSASEAQFPQAGRLVRRKNSRIPGLAMSDFERMLSLEKWQRVRFAIAIVFPSPSYVRWRYNPKPVWIWPFYYPYRWGRMVREAVLTLIYLYLQRLGS